MIKDYWFRTVFLGLSCHWWISYTNISYFPLNITPFSECNLTASRLPAGLVKCKKHPFLYQNTVIGWTGTRFLTLYSIILCLFSDSSTGSRSPVTSGVTRRQSRRYFVDCKGIFTPHVTYLGTKRYPSFTNRGNAEVLKRPLLPRNTLRRCGPHLCYPWRHSLLFSTNRGRLFLFITETCLYPP